MSREQSGKEDVSYMLDRNSPVGVLDSGIGGFSVVRQVQRLLPGEELIYFGDGAHVPYGNHREEEIVAMARYLFRFMEEHGVKALLVACNTISCVIGQCRDAVSCPVFNAVQAGAEVVGAACAIEKGFQHGGDRLRAQGVRVESLAIVESMDENGLTFR